jgi:hypothetical protein
VSRRMPLTFFSRARVASRCILRSSALSGYASPSPHNVARALATAAQVSLEEGLYCSMPSRPVLTPAGSAARKRCWAHPDPGASGQAAEHRDLRSH